MGRCRENLLATSRRCFAAFSTDYIKLFGHLSLLSLDLFTLSLNFVLPYLLLLNIYKQLKTPLPCSRIFRDK